MSKVKKSVTTGKGLLQPTLNGLFARRTVTIPKKVGGKDILALIELGGKVLKSKDVVYQRIFELAYEPLKKVLKDEVYRNGGDDDHFARLLNEAEQKLKNRAEA